MYDVVGMGGKIHEPSAPSVSAVCGGRRCIRNSMLSYRIIHLCHVRHWTERSMAFYRPPNHPSQPCTALDGAFEGSLKLSERVVFVVYGTRRSVRRGYRGVANVPSVSCPTLGGACECRLFTVLRVCISPSIPFYGTIKGI